MEMRLENRTAERMKMTEFFPDKRTISKSGVWRLQDSEYVLKSCLVRLRLYPDFEGSKIYEYRKNSGAYFYDFKVDKQTGIYRYRLLKNMREVFQITFFVKGITSPVRVFSVFSDWSSTMATDQHVKTGFDFLEAHLNGNDYV